MTKDLFVMCVVAFPCGWFINLACIEAMSCATAKWDRALWKLFALFGSFLMGLSFVAFVWALPRP